MNHYRYIQRYFFISMFFFVAIYCFLCLFFDISLPTNDVLIIQAVSFIFFVSTFILGVRLKMPDILIVIFVYQLILSVSLFLSHSFEYNVDYINYKSMAENGLNLTAGDFVQYIFTTFSESATYSDLGYPFILRFIYQITGNSNYGDFVMCLLNVFLELPTLYFVYKLSSYMFSRAEAKMAVLLWGLNLYSVWTNASGMKETIFVLISTGASYYLYRYSIIRNTRNLFLCIVFIIGTFFFRSYITFFFVLVFVAIRFFQKVYNNWFVTILIFSLVSIYVATTLLSYFVPDVVAILAQRDFLWANTGLSGNIFNVISAFIAPYPAIGSSNQNVNLLILMFTFFKVFFSVWGIIGVFGIIKSKETHAYPLINILYLNILLTIIAGFSLNYRYMHVTMPLYVIFIVHGFYSIKGKKIKLIIIPYFILVALVIIVYNLRSVG